MAHADRCAPVPGPACVGDARPDQSGRTAAEWALGGLGCLIGVLVPLAVLALPRSDVVAIVGTPGGGAADSIRIVAEAGGTVLNRGGPDNVLLIRSDQDGFALRLYAAGASLVVDGRLAAGCGLSTVRTGSPNATPNSAWSPPQ